MKRVLSELLRLALVGIATLMSGCANACPTCCK